jgi:hypothetical protein
MRKAKKTSVGLVPAVEQSTGESVMGSSVTSVKIAAHFQLIEIKA